MRITLPIRSKMPKRTNCKECNVYLDEKNRLRNNGKTQPRCKPCNRKFLKKYNDKRREANKNKLW
tara:strand:- start:2359 stop:2553 length:195 start_codon:yes stop_codon:yes gene_type:complete